MSPSRLFPSHRFPFSPSHFRAGSPLGTCFPLRAGLRQRAAVLILVLWAIAVLGLLAGGLSFAIRQDLAIANIQRDRLVAHWLARAGVERSIASLMDDIDATDTLQDLWADNESQFRDFEMSGGSFSVVRDGYEDVPNEWFGAGDECAKLNVNVATRDQLMKLPEMTNPVAAAILDWRDSNEDPEPDGIERGHYAGLPHPYIIRNGPMRTVRELLLVRGVTPDLFYGEDTNVNGRLDPNENDGNASDPPDNADGRLDRGWYAYLTVYSFEKNVNARGQKRLNLTSADAATLASRLGLEDWAAQSIVKRREQSEFKHLVDLLDVQRDPSVPRGSAEQDLNARDDSEKDRPITNSIFRSIVDELTLKDDEVLSGRVNINTAPLVVLRTLMDDELADAVVRQREGDGYFSSVGDLLEVTGMTREKFAALENSVAIRSSVFRVHGQGLAASGLAAAWIECVLDRSAEVPRVLFWLESTP